MQVDMEDMWVNFILGLNFIFFCFKIIIKYYHTQKQKKLKFKPRIELNHFICILCFGNPLKNIRSVL